MVALDGDWPDGPQSADFAALVASWRGLPGSVAALLAAAPLDSANPMAVLRTAVSLLGAEDPTADDTSRDAVVAKAARLVGCLPTMVAVMSRYPQGAEPVEPDPDLDHIRRVSETGERPSSASPVAGGWGVSRVITRHPAPSRLRLRRLPLALSSLVI